MTQVPTDKELTILTDCSFHILYLFNSISGTHVITLMNMKHSILGEGSFWKSLFLNLLLKIYFVTGPGTCPYINQHVYIKVSESFFIRTFSPFSCDVNTYPQKAGRVFPGLTTPDRFRWKPLLIMWLVSVLKGCTPESREGHSSVSDAAPSEK